jgi:HEAT repeat protein
LGELGDKRAFEPLITALKDEDRSVRSSASGALGELGDKRAVEPLIAALKDKDAGVRGSVARALAQLGDERAVEPLRQALKDDDGKVLSSVAFALAQLLGDERAVEPLLMATENVGEWDGLALLGMLMRIGPPAVEPLIAALKQEDKRVRYTAAYVLVPLDDKRAVEPLITVLKGEYQDMQRAEGKALEGIGPSTVEQLIALLKHKESLVRSSSAWVLGWLGDKRAVEPLVEAMGDSLAVGNAAEGQFEAAVALGRLGDRRPIEPLIRELKRLAQFEDQERLAQFKDEVGDLFGKLPGQAQYQRRSVVKRLDALVKIGPPAVEPLIGVLKDESAHVRSFAAEGLGELGDKRAIQPLVALLKDEDEEVRRSATKALTKLGWQPGDELQ